MLAPTERATAVVSVPTTPHRSRPGGRTLLGAVCASHSLLSIVFVVTGHMWWQQDEVVYLSQVAAHTPALAFTPPRARGLPVLLFPVVHVTTNVAVIRSYIAVLSAILLYVGLLPWVRLGFSRSAAAAAGLFSLLWATSFFGAEAQPNIFVATIAVGVLGYFLLALRDREATTRHLLVTALLLALLGLIRPSDATWFVAPLFGGVFLLRGLSWQHRARLGSALGIGLILGWLEWIIEAQTSYGGFFHRLHMANQLNTPGIHWSLLTEARDINGPVLCRPCSGVPLNATHFLWWFAIPPLVAIGVLGARRTARFLPLVLATACGTALLLEYCLTVNYAAPRFLLPTYLLLALPCAAGVGTLLRWRPDSGSHLVALTAVVVLLVAFAGSQVGALRHSVTQAADNRSRFTGAAAKLRAAGVQQPCVIVGSYGPPVAFALGCQDQTTTAAHFTPPGHATIVDLSATPRPKAFPGWTPVTLRKHRTGWTAYVS